MSRLTLAHPAIRPADPGRVLISGPPGSGRTETALVVATVLADGGRVLLVDTDHPAALDHADRFGFDVIPWQPPHAPAELRATLIDAADEYAAVIIDTTTEQWFGRGGVRERADDVGWTTARAEHAELLDTIRSSPAHVVGTCDTLIAYQVDEENRTVRVGTELRHDVGIESRWQVAVTIDAAHTLTVTNSPGALSGSWPAGEAAEFARAYAEWLATGEERVPVELVDDLRERVMALPVPAMNQAKARLRRLTGGNIERLLVCQYDAAEAIVAELEPEPVVYGPPTPDPASDGDEGEGEAA